MTFHTHLVTNVVRSLIDEVVNVVQQLCVVSGYIQRRLIKAMESVMVKCVDV